MNRQYHELAKYYDQVYHWKDYRKEATKIRGLIRRFKESSGNELLDVGCGTGRHIQYLKHDFDCVGIDISEEMLKVARRTVTGADFVRSDMVDFDLGTSFDVILCLFSAIGYLKTRDDVRKAIRNFAEHLKKGGVLIVEPWFRKSEWRNGWVHMGTYDGSSVKIARVGFSRMTEKFSVLDERYVIATKGRGIAYVRDLQKLRFFEPAWTFEIMRRLGLDLQDTEDSLMPHRKLIVAVKR